MKDDFLEALRGVPRSAKRFALFGFLFLCFLFIFQHINWETGEVYPPFYETPTPTPTLIDVLAKKLWEADGSQVSEGYTERQTLHRYGDLFAANAFGCKMDYVDFFDLVVEKAEEYREIDPEIDSHHIRIIGFVRFERDPELSCEEHLSFKMRVLRLP